MYGTFVYASTVYGGAGYGFRPVVLVTIKKVDGIQKILFVEGSLDSGKKDGSSVQSVIEQTLDKILSDGLMNKVDEDGGMSQNLVDEYMEKLSFDSSIDFTNQDGEKGQFKMSGDADIGQIDSNSAISHFDSYIDFM